MANLKITDAAGRAFTHELSSAETFAGRASSNDIQINDEKSSRQHFKLERRDDGFVVSDLGSTNGTRVNGVKITEPVLLLNGDTVSVGKCDYVFEDDEAAAFSINAADGRNAGVENAGRAVAEATAQNQVAEFSKTITDVRMGALEKDFSADDEHKKSGQPHFVLKMLEGATPGKVFDLGAEPVTLGRHASNTIPIDDEAASNYHAEVAQEAIGCVVTDLGSTNGTRVKARGRADFEKVVKTPLAPGMQIRIGKTLLEFQNLGAPVAEEDQVFKTLELDTEKFHQKMAALQAAGGVQPVASGGMGMFPKIALAVCLAALIAVGVIFLPPLFKKNAGGEAVQKDLNKDGPPKVARPASNLVVNGNFEEGTDEDGYPVDFQVSKAADVHIKITPDARHGESKDPKSRGLQISKGGAKAQSRQTVVESRDPIQIDAGKTYEIAAWARNDEDGIYGLRVAWVRGDRELAENPVVLKDSQEWKELKSPALTPPAWATHVRAGVFVQGKSGKASFDGLSFKEKSGGVPQRIPAIRFGGIELQFEGLKGLFSVSSQGKTVAEDGTLRLETSDGKTATDLASAMKPAVNKNGDNGGVSYEGRLYDFSLQDLANYSIAAQPGAVGVDLRAAFELPADSASKPALRFYLTGPAATGDIDVSKSDKSTERLAATDDKSVPAVKGVLFNAGKAPQFNLIFAKPVELNLKREGKRRLVEIRFENEVQISMAPEDVEQKQKMQSAVADLRKALAAKEWGGAEEKSAQLKTQYGASFVQAQEETARAAEALDAAWKASQDELAQMLAALQKAPTPELLEKAKQASQRVSDAWKGSAEKTAVLGGITAQIDAIAAVATSVDAEKKAEEALRQAESYMDKKIYTVAISYLKSKILDDPIASKTKAAERAKELLPKAEAAQKKMDDIASISERLKGLAKNYILSKKYNEAIRAIETDPEYKSNRADLTDIQALLDDLRKK